MERRLQGKKFKSNRKISNEKQNISVKHTNPFTSILKWRYLMDAQSNGETKYIPSNRN
jgi:hypothetical protein